MRSCLLDHTPDANWGNWAYRILVNVDRIDPQEIPQFQVKWTQSPPQNFTNTYQKLWFWKCISFHMPSFWVSTCWISGVYWKNVLQNFGHPKKWWFWVTWTQRHNHPPKTNGPTFHHETWQNEEVRNKERMFGVGIFGWNSPRLHPKQTNGRNLETGLFGIRKTSTKTHQLLKTWLGGGFPIFFMFSPIFGRITNLTSIFFRWPCKLIKGFGKTQGSADLSFA